MLNATRQISINIGTLPLNRRMEGFWIFKIIIEQPRSQQQGPGSGMVVVVGETGALQFPL